MEAIINIHGLQNEFCSYFDIPELRQQLKKDLITIINFTVLDNFGEPNDFQIMLDAESMDAELRLLLPGNDPDIEVALITDGELAGILAGSLRVTDYDTRRASMFTGTANGITDTWMGDIDVQIVQ